MLIHGYQRRQMIIPQQNSDRIILLKGGWDTSNKEQAAFGIWGWDKFEDNENLLGLFSAGSLMALMCDIMLWLNLSFSKYVASAMMAQQACRSKGRSGNSNFEKGTTSSVHTLLWSLINLACSDTIKRCKVMCDALDVMYEITKPVNKSPHRDALLVKIKEQLSNTSRGVCIWYPTQVDY